MFPTRLSLSLLGSSTTLAVLVILSGYSTCGVFAAEDNTSSLESLWSDNSQATAAASPPAPLKPSPSKVLDTSAPLCSLEELKASSIMQKATWPGIGPFKSQGDSASEFTDAAQNHIRLDVANSQVTKAELSLLKDKPVAGDFLDIQMAANFFLEGLGAKPARIAAFNREMEKSTDAILNKSEQKPVELNAGRYLVSIQRQPLKGSDKFNFLMRVTNQEASADVLKEHAAVSETEVQPPTTKATTPVVEAKKPAVNHQDLKNTFVGVISNWQKLKKVAVRERQTSELSTVLSGRALVRQTDAVKWLAANHKYYEMNPKAVIVDKYTELAAGKKYAVFAQVKEASKYIDEPSGQVVKEVEDTYKVNYTIEKLGDSWFITDSSIINTTASPNAAPQANRPQPAKASH